MQNVSLVVNKASLSKFKINAGPKRKNVTAKPASLVAPPAPSVPAAPIVEEATTIDTVPTRDIPDQTIESAPVPVFMPPVIVAREAVPALSAPPALPAPIMDSPPVSAPVISTQSMPPPAFKPVLKPVNTAPRALQQSVSVEISSTERPVKPAAKKQSKPRTKRKALDELPDDDASSTITSGTSSKKQMDPQVTTIADLCKSSYNNPGDSRMKRALKKSKKTQDEAAESNAAATASSSSSAFKKSYSGPKVRVVDGQIIVDAESVQVNQNPAETLDLENMEQVEESHESRHITSASFSKHVRGDKWTAEDNALFFEGLKCWGTDFEMISRMFPNRSRRHVKLKYQREEKKSPLAIENALRIRSRPTAATMPNLTPRPVDSRATPASQTSSAEASQTATPPVLTAASSPALTLTATPTISTTAISPAELEIVEETGDFQPETLSDLDEDDGLEDF